MWCTTERTLGRTSTAEIHLSSVKLVCAKKSVYSTAPFAGTLKSVPRSRTTSGLPIVHPSGNRRGAGASFGSPAGAPASAQAISTSISSLLKDRSLDILAECASSACQGGIFLLTTAWRIDFTQGLTS